MPRLDATRSIKHATRIENWVVQCSKFRKFCLRMMVAFRTIAEFRLVFCYIPLESNVCYLSFIYLLFAFQKLTPAFLAVTQRYPFYVFWIRYHC